MYRMTLDGGSLEVQAVINDEPKDCKIELALVTTEGSVKLLLNSIKFIELLEALHRASVDIIKATMAYKCSDEEVIVTDGHGLLGGTYQA